MRAGQGPAGSHTRGSEAWLLSERVKELDCLYGISRLFERSSGRLEDTLKRVVELLPPAWQHEDVAEARIVLYGQTYATAGFRETAWEQTCPVIVLGDKAGWVTVSYTEARPESDEGPFMREERSLLNAVAQRLGGLIEREQSRQQLLTYQENLRSLAAELAASEQRERRQIAELLHDRIGQSLALLSIKLAQALARADEPALRESLAESQAIAAEVIAETRSLTFELCPPILYELGLRQAVEWLADEFHDKFGLDVSIWESGDPGLLSEELRTTLFQALRELLTNVAKHAEAGTARVILAGGGDTVTVTVEDDGRGMDEAELAARITPHHGFGLFNIRERLSYVGGSMSTYSTPGQGTRVTLEVPSDV